MRERPEASAGSGDPRAAASPLADRALSLLLLWAALALGLALTELERSETLGFRFGGAAAAVAAQLPVTGPATVLVLAATVINVLAGSIVLRLLRGRPFATPADTILGGLAGAVVLDAALLFGLGGAGLFGLPELAVVHAVLIGLGWRWGRPLVVGQGSLLVPRPAAWWLVVGLVWAAPVVLALASPVVPFMDVLPNHVAPVEHLRAFGDQATLVTMPSPIYGPSRLFLGYVGLLGILTVLTGLHAALAVSAFVLPLALLCAVAAYDLARRLFGRTAGTWALLTFPLTFAFVRLSDARATVLVLPLVAWSLARLALPATRTGPLAAGPGRSWRAPSLDVNLALALGAAILVHPVAGAATVATGLVAIPFDGARLGRRVLPAAAAAAGLALPQAATMLGLALPAISGLVAYPVAVGLGLGVAAILDRVRVPWRSLTVAVVGLAALALLLLARGVLSDVLSDVLPVVEDYGDRFRLLGLLAVGGAILTLRGRPRAWRILVAGLTVFVVTSAAVGLLPDATLLDQSIRYELPKSLGYWAPLLLATAAAGFLADVWRRRRLGWLRHVVIGAFLLGAIVPLSGPFARSVDIKEHRLAETVAADLQEAERGSWTGYPDVRLVVDAAGTSVVGALRDEERTGRLGPDSSVLHVAKSFQQWASVPIGVFTGAMETTLSLDPEHSIHTVGGRLYGLDSLGTSLAGRPAYVVLEQAGLPSSVRDRIIAAGYRLMFANARAEIFVPG